MNLENLKELIETELAVDDSICINGCDAVYYGHICCECGAKQDLSSRTPAEKAEDLAFLIESIREPRNFLGTPLCLA